MMHTPSTDLKATRQRLQTLGQQNLFKHAIARDAGGLGDNFQDLVQIHRQLGQTSLDTGLILSLNAHLWGSLFPLLHHASDTQRHYFEKLLTGQWIGGHAITEPQAGSDLTRLTLNAQRTDSGFLLNGHKRFITNTPIADMLIVYARLDSRLSAFIVEKDDHGAEFCHGPNVEGCKSATMGDVILKNCLIPEQRLLGKAGAGNLLIQQALELERAFIFAGISGIMAEQLKCVIDHSRKRRINGSHLGKNQAISHKIADMKLRLDTLNLWLEKCAHLKDSQQRITLASAQTKLYGAESFVASSLDAVQIIGSAALLGEQPFLRWTSDALASRLFSGSSEIQKNIIAALLGTGEGYRLPPEHP
ncbi:acyl-CoA dehydrogenase family protein [methane-oxidizing endosymbiont of Gigantopelta aegis]|uniref:acyl-CoA dehydrogenase family protein n=1 Tax=methane-oxidizing endosymbiont of Gigantopelta aegis TaxID=2794938 RepID=UPI0018DD7330|nr:acyl-CoA dehydrogenase family protein [methane-oxidizing endosymbiont of Gigantopelta aegis]